MSNELNENIDLTICDHDFDIILVPEIEVALDLFNKAKVIFTKHNYLDGDEEYPPEDDDSYGRELSGLVINKYQNISSDKFIPEPIGDRVLGEVGHGDGYDDNPEVLNELKKMLNDSKLINDNFIYFQMDKVTGIGFSKDCVGFEFRNGMEEEDFDD